MEPKYHFTHLKSKNFNILTNKTALDYLMKWSIKGQLKLTTFSFNESFQSYQKHDLLEDFFRDTAVTAVLNQLLPCWSHNETQIEKIETEVVPCTVSSMSFFDRLLDETNNIVRGDFIRHCLDDVIDGFMVSDELRKMLIDEESDNYGLFNETDRSELIFRIFRFLVLGGKWCQYEDKITSYLDLTKILYKDLLRVEKNPETKEIEIKSVCLKVKLIGKKNIALFPVDADHIQNFAYVIVDPTFRQLTLFAHEYGALNMSVPALQNPTGSVRRVCKVNWLVFLQFSSVLKVVTWQLPFYPTAIPKYCTEYREGCEPLRYNFREKMGL